MIYLIDTHAWVEYVIGSTSAVVMKRLFENPKNKFITSECSLAEIRSYCLINKRNFEEVYKIVKRNSITLPVLHYHWIEAAKIRFEIRKRVKDFGLIDSILVVKQNELKATIISGDSHFKGQKNVMYIGK